jgi:hypothetical protein
MGLKSGGGAAARKDKAFAEKHSFSANRAAEPWDLVQTGAGQGNQLSAKEKILDLACEFLNNQNYTVC